jgi:hypothetical protein
LTRANYWRWQNKGVNKNIATHKIFASAKYLQNIGVDEKVGAYKITGVNRNIGVYKIIGVNRNIGVDRNIGIC